MAKEPIAAGGAGDDERGPDQPEDLRRQPAPDGGAGSAAGDLQAPEETAAPEDTAGPEEWGSGLDEIEALEPLADTDLLDHVRQGHRVALDLLIRRHEPWVRRRVRERLGAKVRRRFDSSDAYQEVMLRLIKASMAVPVTSSEHFRRRLAVIIENTIRDLVDYVKAQVRDVDRDDIFTTRMADYLSAPEKDPCEQAHDNQAQAELQLAMLIISPAHSAVIRMRTYQGLTFPRIGRRLGLSEGAARMRYQRAAAKLASTMERIRRGEELTLLDELLREACDEDGGDEDGCVDGPGAAS